MIFAEVADPLGGWGQIILQGSSFCLLVYIIAVMYPRAVIEDRKERLARDEAFAELVNNLESGFRDRNKEIATGLLNQTSELKNAIERNSSTVTQAMYTICKNQNERHS